jgi:hypothetical protein
VCAPLRKKGSLLPMRVSVGFFRISTTRLRFLPRAEYRQALSQRAKQRQWTLRMRTVPGLGETALNESLERREAREPGLVTPRGLMAPSHTPTAFDPLTHLSHRHRPQRQASVPQL